MSSSHRETNLKDFISCRLVSAIVVNKPISDPPILSKTLIDNAYGRNFWFSTSCICVHVKSRVRIKQDNVRTLVSLSVIYHLLKCRFNMRSILRVLHSRCTLDSGYPPYTSYLDVLFSLTRFESPTDVLQYAVHVVSSSEQDRHFCHVVSQIVHSGKVHPGLWNSFSWSISVLERHIGSISSTTHASRQFLFLYSP